MNNLKTIIYMFVTVTLLTVAINTFAFSQSVRAPVVSVTPITVNQSVMVKQEYCRPIITGYNDGMRGSTTGSIIGAVLGSMIGENDSQRRIMTGVGAVIGGRVGSKHNTEPHVEYGRTYCGYKDSNQVQKVIQGYKVTYILNGTHHTTEMSYNPGNFVTIQTSYTIR
tara:strand:- start:1717 stop:2217 length:501 start_codon:yes stop_codon:yes gene_type:complete